MIDSVIGVMKLNQTRTQPKKVIVSVYVPRGEKLWCAYLAKKSNNTISRIVGGIIHEAYKKAVKNGYMPGKE